MTYIVLVEVIVQEIFCLNKILLAIISDFIDHFFASGFR